MNYHPAPVKSKRVSPGASRKEDALELARILYDIYIEQIKDVEDHDEQE